MSLPDRFSVFRRWPVNEGEQGREDEMGKGGEGENSGCDGPDAGDRCGAEKQVRNPIRQWWDGEDENGRDENQSAHHEHRKEKFAKLWVVWIHQRKDVPSRSLDSHRRSPHALGRGLALPSKDSRVTS